MTALGATATPLMRLSQFTLLSSAGSTFQSAPMIHGPWIFVRISATTCRIWRFSSESPSESLSHTERTCIPPLSTAPTQVTAILCRKAAGTRSSELFSMPTCLPVATAHPPLYLLLAVRSAAVGRMLQPWCSASFAAALSLF